MSGLDDLAHAARLAASDSSAGTREGVDGLPWFGTSIDADRTAGLFAAWGRSTVVDENTGTAVIPRTLFDGLHARAGIDAEWPIGNAGLIHCYGYLLSLEETPYGLKRDRWTGSALATSCGLAPDAFHPWNDGPTLLARATAAASTLLARPATSAAIRTDGRESRVALSTAAGPAALAYAVAPHAGEAPLLVTMFPVAEASVPLAEFTSDPRLRWNAV